MKFCSSKITNNNFNLYMRRFFFCLVNTCIVLWSTMCISVFVYSECKDIIRFLIDCEIILIVKARIRLIFSNNKCFWSLTFYTHINIKQNYLPSLKLVIYVFSTHFAHYFSLELNFSSKSSLKAVQIQNNLTEMFLILHSTICLFVLLLYVPIQQLWSWQDGQFT